MELGNLLRTPSPFSFFAYFPRALSPVSIQGCHLLNSCARTRALCISFCPSRSSAIHVRRFLVPAARIAAAPSHPQFLLCISTYVNARSSVWSCSTVDPPWFMKLGPRALAVKLHRHQPVSEDCTRSFFFARFRLPSRSVKRASFARGISTWLGSDWLGEKEIRRFGALTLLVLIFDRKSEGWPILESARISIIRYFLFGIGEKVEE